MLIFNILFAAITFPLDGSMRRKLSLLAMGNLVGLTWSCVFSYFSSAGTEAFGLQFDAIYTIIYPLLNLMWVVPFWSLSLGFLPRTKLPEAEGEAK